MEDYINSIISDSINSTINPTADATGNYIYHAMYAVGFVLMLLFNVFINYKAYKFTRLRTFVYSLITFAYGYLGAMFIGFLYNVIASIKGLTGTIRVDMIGAILFMLLWIPTVHVENYIRKRKAKPNYNIDAKRTKIEHISFRDTLDFIAPGAFIVLACIKFGCNFSGCCFGVESDWGVFSPKIFTTVFPIQIFEFATICLIIITTYFIKQTKFYRRGMGGPLAVAMYAFSRFCWEFLRYYTPEFKNFFLGLSIWQLICVVIFVIVFVWVIGLYKTQPSEPKPKNYLFAKNSKKTVSSKGK